MKNLLLFCFCTYIACVSGTNFDEIEMWAHQGKKTLEKEEPVQRRRLADIGAKCQMPGCSASNDPYTQCWNQNDACSGGKACLFDGWGSSGLPKAKCKDTSTDSCTPITSSQKLDANGVTVYEDYVYSSGDPTTLPGGGVGPACMFPFTYNGVVYNDCITANEPLGTSSVPDQGYLGLPWCATGSNAWAYCFPNGSPSCSFNNGLIRDGEGTLSSCTLSCTGGYTGYTSAPTCYNGNRAAITMPASPVQAGCTQILCAPYSPDLSIFEGSTVADSCASTNILAAGTSCSLQCKAGFEATGGGIVSCSVNANPDDPVNVDLSCSPKSCAPFNLAGLTEMTGDGVTNGCVQDQILDTTSSSKCYIRCKNANGTSAFLWEVYCAENANADGSSPPSVPSGLSCSTEMCDTYVYNPELEPATIQGCPEDAITLSVEQSCDLSCRNGYQASDQAFRSSNIQTIKCTSTKTYDSEPSCVPNTCSPFYFEEGMTSATGVGCENGTVLVTNIVNASLGQKSSCFVSCKRGYRTTLSDAFGGRVFCASDAQEGDAVQYTYQCTENKCSALQLESLGLTGLGSTSACQNQQQLSTHTNPSCQVTCMQGYESSTSNATYTCDSNSANGDSAQISPAITCAENICRVKLSAGMAAAPVSELCAECVNGLSLFTHSQPNCCNVKCDSGYYASSTQSTETLTCPETATDDFELSASNVTCSIAITEIAMGCASNSNGCESVGNTGSTSQMRQCSNVQDKIDADSNVLIATEGGDFVIFSNFIATQGTHWKLFVDETIPGENCVTFGSNNTMTCTIPAGSGRGRRLSLMKYDSFNEKYVDTEILLGCLVDYAEPIVTEIVGCPANGCSRDGGDLITIRGSNFGLSGALIFINGVECQNVTHSCNSGSGPENCHRNVQCTTRGLETWQSQINTLLVVQSNLFGSTSELQFQKCPKGTTQTSFDNSCVSCLEGSYSDTEDAFECLSCKAGTFSDSPNQESCTPCRKNFVSRESGATLCTECPGGKHSIEGSSECESCGIWYTGESDGSHCDTAVFGIIFGLLVVIFVLGLVICLYRKYYTMVDMVETTKASHETLMQDVALLQKAWLLEWDQLLIEKKLAEGGGGAVFRGKLQGIDVAVKTIFHTRDVNVADQSEVQWMQRARHPRLILFFGMGKQPKPDGGNIFIAIEFMNHGDLLAKLESRDDEIKSWKLRMRLLEDVALGMQYIHTQLQSIHRDLKSENVLLDYEGGVLRAKIADFGLSRIVPKVQKEPERKSTALNLFRSNTGRKSQGNSSTHTSTSSDISGPASLKFTEVQMTSAKGTVAYMAPELLTREALRGDENIAYSQAIDTYAYGCIMWEVLCFARIWGQFKFSTQVIDLVLEGKRPEIPRVYDKAMKKPPPGYIQLMRVCWDQMPSQRPKMGRIIEALKCLYINSPSVPPSVGVVMGVPSPSTEKNRASRLQRPPLKRPPVAPRKKKTPVQRSAHITGQGEPGRHSKGYQHMPSEVSTKESDLMSNCDGIDDDML